MKRTALLCAALALAVTTGAQAQLTMQMSNGWTFSFAGNVNAFLVYEKEDQDGTTSSTGTLVGASSDGATRIRTGLLPAFAVFDAKGKEGETDLSVHFGFAPQIQCGVTNSVAGTLHDCFGAQIDMRQVYLTVGGTWGQILAGRELGLYGRQNILTDQTLFGVGGTGGQFGQGTTLGRIGFGYIYPQFKAQMTYTSPAGRPLSFSIGVFDPAINGPYSVIELPRLEAEAVWTQGNTKVWGGGVLQNNSTPEVPAGPSSESATAWGLSGGVRFGTSQFSLTGSGYYGKGLGTTLMFGDDAALGGGTGGAGTGGSDDLRKSYGYIGQITFTPANSKVTVAGSFGESNLQQADTETFSFRTVNGLISGGIYYQATKSLKVVGEFNYAYSDDRDHDPLLGPEPEKNSSFAPAFGFMLFF